MEKILIIKTGHSETFAEEVGGTICSLGDVLRTVPIILGMFPTHKWNIDWLTDQRAIELFDLFDETLSLKIAERDQIEYDSYDIVLNLEKDFVLEGNNIFGFTSSSTIRRIGEDSHLEVDFPIADDHSIEQKFEEFFNIEVNLAELKIQPKYKSEPIYEFGLNWKAGPKWPQKMLPKEYWHSWFEQISKKTTVSWQEGFNSIFEYISWIASCETIITLDSLGLHVANILGKNTIVLYGPTPCEKSLYPNFRKIFYYRDEKETAEIKEKILDYLSNE